MRRREITAEVIYVDNAPTLVVLDWGTATRFAYKGKNADDEASFLRFADAINAVPIVKQDTLPRIWELDAASFIAGGVVASVVLSLLTRFV